MIYSNDTFLTRVNQYIEQHLSDTSLDVTHLTRGVGMSRTDLHRKMVGKVGMSTTEYIRHVRIQHAALLLVNQPDWPLSHIAYEVGFTSQSYFTRTFIDMFRMCPSVYRKSSKHLDS